MTHQATERHRELEGRLIAGRLQGSLTEAEDDAISEEMADLWYEMSDYEQKATRERIAIYARSLVLGRPMEATHAPAGVTEFKEPWLAQKARVSCVQSDSVSPSGVSRSGVLANRLQPANQTRKAQLVGA